MYRNNYGNSFANQLPYQSYRQAPERGAPRSNLPLPASRQPLRITAESTSGSTNPPQNPSNPYFGNNNGGFVRQGSRPNAGFFNRSQQGRPLRPQGTAYQANESESEPSPSHDESGSTQEETQEDHLDSEPSEDYYADKDLDYY